MSNRFHPRLILLALFCSMTLSTFCQELQHVEPPFWWRDMNNKNLQIMVHGEGIGQSQVSLDGDVARLVSVHQTDSPNYLFVDVIIAGGSEADAFNLSFTKNRTEVASYRYELRAREAGSAMRKGFDNSDVMYLITPDRFVNGNPDNDEVAGMREGSDRTVEFGRHGGDIEGMRQSLDYIKDMGFTAIWLNPVLENDQDGWSYHGYATTDYYKVDSRFGSNEEYVRLSEEADAIGVKMIMDIIVNHCGSRHWWMEDPPSSDWIHFLNEEYVETNHRKSTMLDPYVAPGDREKMVKGWFVKEMPDLNQKNQYLSTYLIQNSIWWIEYAKLAGIRQDTYSYPYRDFMSDWTCAIMDEYPHFNIVGEEWVGDHSIIAYWQRGKDNHDGYTSCLPSLMDFTMNGALREALVENEEWETGMTKLWMNLSNDYHFADPNNLVIFPDNHDMSRIFKVLGGDYDLFKMAISYIMTIRGIPQLYYGTEILMTHLDSDSHGVIRSDFPGGWQGDQVNAFTGVGLSDQEKEARAFVKKLLTWRQSATAVHYGDLMHYQPYNGTYVYFRSDENQSVMVVMNKSPEPVQLELARFEENLDGFNQGVDVTTGKQFSLGSEIALPARSCFILELK